MDRARIPLIQQAAVILAGPAATIGRDLWSLDAGVRGADGAWVVLWAMLPSLPYAMWLAALPLVLLAERRPPLGEREGSAAACFLLCAAAGFACAAGFGWRVRDLPPLYHDEYGYLFQTETFLAGRFHWPVPAFADALDQMHILHQPVFASRFFPGTGLWLAPFAAAGAPIWGMWTAAGLTAGFVALAGRRFSPLAGYAAGLLFASAPATVAFDNLLLSPGPTMLFFSVFLWTFFRSFEETGARWPLLAGLSIGAAFLTRPLTALGLGFPFALYVAWQGLRRRTPSDRQRFRAMSASFAACVLAMGGYNAALTGNPVQTPYGVYLRERTPSHVYGFYNVERGSTRRGPAALDAYERWAENLTPARAVALTLERCKRLVRATVGETLFFGFGLLAVLRIFSLGDRLLLLALSVLGLIVAYFPYAFPGILGFSYVAEAGPSLVLIVAAALGTLLQDAFARGRPLLAAWWMGLPTVAIVLNLALSNPALFEDQSELVYPRRKADRLRSLEREAAKRGPILVLMDVAPNQSLHETFVYNEPSLSGPVLRAWARSPEAEPLIASEPRRAVYRYRPESSTERETWTLVRPAAAAGWTDGRGPVK